MVTGCLVAGGLAFVGGPANADDQVPSSAGMSNADVQLMLHQIPFGNAARAIKHAAEGVAGYGGVAIDGDSVTVWWQGSPPSTVAAVIAAQRRTVPVVVRPATYSFAELYAAAAPLGELIKANPNGPYFAVQIPADGSGLVLVKDQAADAAMALALPNVGVPVRIRVSGRTHTVASRVADASPYSGGAELDNPETATRCTSSFGVRESNGTKRLLTAGHCGRTGGAQDTGAGVQIGAGTRENVAHDILLVSAPNVSNQIWDGGAFGSNNSKKTVVGSADAIPNESVCFSGVSSGASCSWITSNNFTYSYCGNDAYGHNECYSDMVWADRNGSALGGDSGAPVFTLAGTGKVTAKGTLSGTGTNHIVFQDFVTAQRDFGINVVT